MTDKIRKSVYYSAKFRIINDSGLNRIYERTIYGRPKDDEDALEKAISMSKLDVWRLTNEQVLKGSARLIEVIKKQVTTTTTKIPLRD